MTLMRISIPCYLSSSEKTLKWMLKAGQFYLIHPLKVRHTIRQQQTQSVMDSIVCLLTIRFLVVK